MTENSQFRRTVVERGSTTVRPLAECVELENWVRRGKFTFIIGPGCARIGWEAPEVTKQVRAAMVRLYCFLSDAPDRDFLARLASTYRIDLTLPIDDSPPTEIEQTLRPLRQSLIRIARLGTSRLIDGLRSWQEPVIDWEQVGVGLGIADKGKALLGELDTACQRLADLDEICRAHTQAGVDGGAATRHQAWQNLRELFGIRGIRASLAQIRSVLENGSPLTGNYVEWLTNLVWHSFRYAAAWPPSTDELAFQLGVSWENALITELPERAHATQGQTTQVHALQALRGIYRAASLSQGAQNWEERNRLFGALARLSIRPLHGTEGMTPDSDVANLLGTSDAEYAIFYSSSLDNLLEDAIIDAMRRAKGAEPGAARTADLALHVIVPVLVRNQKSRFEEVGWVYGTRKPDHTTHWRLLRNDNFKPEGPIVVKLNGDPQADIMAVDGLGDGDRIENLVVLSEFQHLTLLLAETNMLFRWLQGRGPEGGSFILLGESVDEWSIRQRLFGQTMFPFWSEPNVSAQSAGNTKGDLDNISEPEVHAISINRKAHLVRHSLFAWVKVREYEGDLSDVGCRLETVLEDLPW